MSLFDFFRSPRRAPVRTSSSEVWQFQGKPVRLVLRPRRKRISVELKPHQPITVRGPMSLSKRQAERFLLEKWDWIEKHWERIAEIPPLLVLDFSKDVALWIHGEHSPLRREVTLLEKVFLGSDESLRPVLYLPLPLFQSRERQAQTLTTDLSLRLWKDFLVRLCRRDLLPLVEALALRMAVQPSRISFKHMRSRWGSCSSQGVIALNSRLAGAPLWVAESVIVHELAHLRHMNHGRDFWAFVEAYAPRHQEADAWLARYSPQIP